MSSFLGCILLALTACDNPIGPLEPGEPPSRAPDGAVIAKVGTGFVTDQDFAQAASRQPKAAEGFDLEARKDVLDQLITDEMLFQEATKRDLYRDPKVRKIMVSLLIREEVFDRIRNEEIPEGELQAFYDAHKDEFTVPEKVQVRRIFVRIDEDRTADDAKALIDDIRKQISRDQGKFAELAEKHSDDPFKRRGGDLGLLTHDGKAGIPSEVVEAAFALPAGGLSQIFEAGGGLNLVLTVSKRDRLERSFEQMKGSVMRRMRNDRFQAMTAEFVDEIRSQYTIEINEQTLANTEVQVQAAPPDINPAELLDVTSPRRGANPSGRSIEPPRIRTP